mgnify:CR=1 FL=1
MFELPALQILFPWLISFFMGFLLAPIVLKYLFKFRVWKKKSGKGGGTPIFNELHKDRETNTPRMGGMVIVLSVLLTTFFFWIVSYAVSGGPSGDFDFLSRSQTWLPMFAFFVGGVIGFVDDIHQIKLSGRWAGGLPVVSRLVPTILFSLFCAWWFYVKLGLSEVYVPFYGPLEIGILFVPFFVTVFVAVFATSNIDGLDGLSGGIMSIIFSAYGFIAFVQGQIDIAAFCFVLVGATLAFLWFNIPPAKFYMTESGYNALAFALVIVAFVTNTVLLLPIIAFCLFITELTTIMQVLSKKIRGKKIFLVAPIHHHFEALGYPAHNVVMRYWIVSMVFAALGVVLALVG